MQGEQIIRNCKCLDYDLEKDYGDLIIVFTEADKRIRIIDRKVIE